MAPESKGVTIDEICPDGFFQLVKFVQVGFFVNWHGWAHHNNLQGCLGMLELCFVLACAKHDGCHNNVWDLIMSQDVNMYSCAPALNP